MCGKVGYINATILHCSILHLQMLSERDAMKRESSIVLSSVAADDRLMKALLEVEDLTKK